MCKIATPQEPKTVYEGTLTDSRQWKYYRPRAGDIVVATPPKSGTTWLQGILALLISGNPQVDASPSENAPWFDTRFKDMDELIPRLDAQKTRRHVKTHTPLDGVPIWEELRYITAYRHPIDVHFSARNHVANYRPEIAKELGIELDKFPADPRASFHIFVEGNELDHGSVQTIVNHYIKCLELEPRENILRLHYADMKHDLEGSVQRITQHIGISHPDEIFKQLVEAATFKSMKSNVHRFGLVAGKNFWRDDAGFFNNATSNKWEGILTKSDLALYDQKMARLIEPEARKWLEWGSNK